MCLSLKEISIRLEEISKKPREEWSAEEVEFIKTEWVMFRNRVGILWESLSTCSEIK